MGPTSVVIILGLIINGLNPLPLLPFMRSPRAPHTHSHHRKAEAKDRRVMLAVIYRLLEESTQNGGPFVGAMLWNGAHNDSSDQDGELLSGFSIEPDVSSFPAFLLLGQHRRLMRTGQGLLYLKILPC